LATGRTRELVERRIREAIEQHLAGMHPSRPGLVTIAGRRSDDLPRGTWASILRQAGLKGDEP
jgi:hypothetical protein